MAKNGEPDYDQNGEEGECKVKIICLGDSAVGKSKLVERFLMDGYKPQQLSTFALTLFNYKTEVDGQKVLVDFWDTAGQERFNNMHPSYYHQAHACILVFDSTRKITYKNLPLWLKELREYRPEIPCLVCANKIDVDLNVTKKSFGFAKKHKMPFYFVSASDGTNVVKMFKNAIKAAVGYKNNSTDFMDEIMRELENFELETDNGLKGQEKDSSVLDSGLHSPRNDDDKDSNRPAS
ncbi:rab-like protein 2A isoform X1 [Ruditapes philippinarum]|uniref:rab-like protein 2A isoform X1 n=1 Tax=Ruditapes philippinarum TaxID=129788 RepID=UPI00295C2C53|nr:rab-like protein 2A isoform X1 [Ruditapes philippinarum]